MEADDTLQQSVTCSPANFARCNGSRAVPPIGWRSLDFFPDRQALSAARPAQRKTVEEFIARMQKLEAEGKLKTFHETMLETTIHVFGNVAVALGACEMLENGEEVTRDVGAFLFVKTPANGVSPDRRRISRPKTTQSRLPSGNRRREPAAPN